MQTPKEYLKAILTDVLRIDEYKHNITLDISENTEKKYIYITIKRRSYFHKFDKWKALQISIHLTNILDKLNIQWAYSLKYIISSKIDMNSIIIYDNIDIDQLSFMLRVKKVII